MNSFASLLNHPDISFLPIPDSIKVDNPATGETLAFVRTTRSDGLKLLIQKAEAAQKLWAAKTALERADVLWRWYFLIKENKEELARIMTMEQGKSLTEARGEIDYAASFVRWFAEEARRIDGDVLTSVKASQKLVVLKQPVGVTAAITPWNFPSAMIARKAAPALAVGCAMIVKPASLTPLSAYALALLAYEAGVPQDLLPVVSVALRKSAMNLPRTRPCAKSASPVRPKSVRKFLPTARRTLKNSVWNWAATLRLSCLTMPIWTKPSKARSPASSATAARPASAPTAFTLNPAFTTHFAAN